MKKELNRQEGGRGRKGERSEGKDIPFSPLAEEA